jgi:hypothetical protein
MTMFAATVVLYGRREERQRKQPLVHVASDQEKGKSNGVMFVCKLLIYAIGNLYSRCVATNEIADAKNVQLPACSPTDDHTPPSLAAQFIHKYYTPFLLHTATKIIVTLLFIVYVSVAIVGCKQMQTGLKVDRV